MSEVYEESSLYRIEERLNLINAEHPKSLRRVKISTFTRAIKAATDDPDYVGSSKAQTGIVEKGADGYVGVTMKTIVSYWRNETTRARLEDTWPTFISFAEAVVVAAREWSVDRAENAVKREDHTSAASCALGMAESTPIIDSYYPLCSGSNAILEEIHKSDQKFLYDRLCKDSEGNMYWDFGRPLGLRMISFSETQGGRKISEDDDDFWTQFIKQNRHFIKQCIDKLVEVSNNYFGSAESYDTLAEMDSVETLLEDLVPQSIMRCMCVRISSRYDPSTKRHVNVSVGAGMNNTKDRSLSIANWTRQLSTELLRSIDIDIVPTMKQWSNKDNDHALYSFSLDTYDNGRCATARPVLPRAWNKFLTGKFKQQMMGELRLAYFVTSYILATNFGRQALYLVGNGKEGKGVLSKALCHIIGDASTTINESNLDPKNLFGLQSIVNKRLLCLMDASNPTEVIESPLFKSITGCDDIFVNRKYKRAVNWRAWGTKMMIVTNKYVYLNNNFALTRVLPIFCQVNYLPTAEADPVDILNALLAEEHEFVQWCFDTVNYYRYSVTRCDGSPNEIISKGHLLLLSDEQFDDYLNFRGEFSETMSDDAWRSVQKTAIMMESPEMFNVMRYQEAGDADDEIIDEILDKYFKFSPELRMKQSELITFLTMKCQQFGPDVDPRDVAMFSALGFDRVSASKLTHSARYKAFIQSILDKGVKKVKVRGFFYFNGIALRESLINSVRSYDEQMNEQVEMFSHDPNDDIPY